MTEVTYRHKDGLHEFSCVGHADYGDAGKDIVCSAVSVLCSALVISLAQLGYDSQVEDGKVEIAVDGYDTTEIKAIFKTVMNGFDLIAEQYPKNFKINQP